jgi:hypothetical protein
MKTPAHRRKKDRFGRAILAPRIQPVSIPTCEPCGKLAYSTEGQAEVFRRRREAEGAAPLRIYTCPSGNGFHLTSKAA